MIKSNISKAIKQSAQKIFFPTPRHLAINQRKVGDEKINEIKMSLKLNYHTGWRNEASYSKAAYEVDLYEHLYGRLHCDRQVVIPWLDDIKPLSGQKILEIGCGTGSSTVALAEQGAVVTGVDIDDGALCVARDRCKAYGLNAEFLKLQSNEIRRVFDVCSFDTIMFFASLEHMTITERLKSLQSAWEILPPGGLLVIVETPNRLWYFDDHTSSLPFFHWLPDALAFQYSKFSPRENFGGLYSDYNEASSEHFLRRGRGMSFHEIDVAIRPVKELKVVSSLSTFYGAWSKFRKSIYERRFKSFLMANCPGLHEGFFDPLLNLIIEKH